MKNFSVDNNEIHLSAFVLTHNSEEFINDCLESLKWVDELIIIDDQSTDRTIEIAESFGAKIFTRSLDNFSSQRNFALEKCNYDWILMLDADEQIPLELQKEIKLLLQSSLITYTGFNIPRKNMFMGTWIRSIYPDYGVRLFRRNGAYYSGDVHEHLNLTGEIGLINSPLIHDSYRNIEEIITKMNHYTSLNAKELLARGKLATLRDLIFRPIFTFIKQYLLKRGFMDGIPGFMLSLFSSYYSFVKYSKLYFLLRKKQPTSSKLD